MNSSKYIGMDVHTATICVVVLDAAAERENRNCGTASMRADGGASQNTPSLIASGWKQEKVQHRGKCFLLTSPSIERIRHPSRPRRDQRGSEGILARLTSPACCRVETRLRGTIARPMSSVCFQARTPPASVTISISSLWEPLVRGLWPRRALALA